MKKREQAKLYYLYMMSDGEVSKDEKKIFNIICKELELGKEIQDSIVKECKEIEERYEMTCIELLENDMGVINLKSDIMELILSGTDETEQRATILWNLINLGYADAHFTSDEREVVDFLREKWEISESVYIEMVDVAETCLALEQHKKWVKQLPESEYKLIKSKQVNQNMKFTQETIKTTISEMSF